MTFTATENDVVKYFDALGTGATDDPYIPRRVLGKNDLATSAWGEPVFVQPHSLGAGVFTFTVPKADWKKMINGTEVYDTSADAFIYSDNGRLKVTASGGNLYRCQTKRHYRYQPNRGHRYSDSVWITSPGTGKLYMVLRTIVGTTVTDTRTEVVGHGLDLSKGNVTDGVFQWRGAGDFWGFGNLTEIAHAEKLGNTTALTITNPAMPVFYEAVQGAHTLGGLARTGSAVRWGLGTSQNGVFWEFEYADTSNPTIHVGCWDVTSQGGQAEGLTYTSITTGLIASTSVNEPAMAFRIPSTRTNDNGNSWVNTIDVMLAQISATAVDESSFEVWITRDSTKISNIVGQSWTPDSLTGAVEYIVNNEGGATTFDFTSAGCFRLLSAIVPINSTMNFTNPLDGLGKYMLTPGDIVICTHSTSGTDNVIISAAFGAEI
jgi:hypothetical protein